MWKYRDSFNITRKSSLTGNTCSLSHLWQSVPQFLYRKGLVKQVRIISSSDLNFTERLMLILRHFICHFFSIFALFLRTEIIFGYKTTVRILHWLELTFELDNLRN